MNKKFSTLVAVLLAAGTWTTLDAEVVVTEGTPAAGSYAIGTDLTGSAVTLELGDFHKAVLGNEETNEIASTQGGEGAAFTNATQWTFSGEIGTSAKMQTTISGTAYYLCYDADQTGAEFYLSADEADTKVLNVKVSDTKVVVVSVGEITEGLASKELSIAAGSVTLAESSNGTDFIWVTADVAAENAVVNTAYVLATAEDLTAVSTYYLTGNFEAAEEPKAAYYDLQKGAETTIANASKDIWTVTFKDETFTLSTVVTGENEGTYVVVADPETGLLTAIKEAEGTIFKLNNNGELVLADETKEFDWSESLKMVNPVDGATNAIQFGKWEDDDTPVEPGDEAPIPYPGYEDVTVDEDGVVTVGEGDDISAPLAVSVDVEVEEGDPKTIYLSVNDKGEVVETETPVVGVASAWGVEDGVYYSIAAKRANPQNRNIYLLEVGTKAVSDTYYLGPKSGEGINPVSPDDVTTTINEGVPAADPVKTVGVLGQNVNRVDAVDKDEYVFVALNAEGTNGTNITVLSKEGEAVALNSIAEADLKDYLWKVTETKNDKGVYYYTFKNMANDQLWSVEAGVTEFYATGKYDAATDLYLSNNGKTIGENFAVAEEAVAISLYKSPLIGRTKKYLNALLGDGFKLTIKTAKDSKDEVEYLDAFAGKLTAQGDEDDQQFQIKSGEKFLVLNKTKLTNITGVNGAFELVDEVDADDHLSYFQINYLFGGKSADLVAELKVAEAASMADATIAYIVKTPDANYLTTKKTLTGSEVRPYITLGEDNIYPIKNLLGQYLTFSYADTRANAKANEEDYKYAGVLAVTNEGTSADDNRVDYVPASSVLLDAPEAQWAVVNVVNGKAVLKNRESELTVEGVQFRLIEGNKFLVTSNNTSFNDDLVTIGKTEAKGRLSYDGFMRTTENTLRNQNFYLGQYHAIEGNNNAYFVENHTDAASHQIGMTAEKEDAQKWNLRFAMKKDNDGKYTLVDTVKVITEFYTLKSDGNQETDPEKMVIDTLAILPYAFQNVSSSEFVSYKNGDNYKYYLCDKSNTKNENQTASRFALKMKPNGTYNFVRVTASSSSDPAEMDDNKVYVANSLTKGSLKNMLTYAEDNNSLMVVEVADAPEYHKIAAAWGDTIKLFREENNAQVLYEKHDAKSVVDKKVLSFLNIDNTNQFDVNPAIFADTAYVNRTIGGEANTCYQYLLAVNVDPEKSYYCPYNPEHNTDEWRDEHNGPCADAKEHRAVYGRFLINLIDTANVYGATHLHNNPYINRIEAGENRAKLSFVDGYHADDTLYVTRKGGEVVKLAMDSPEFNVAKFAFRYTDSEAKTFKIQTQYKEYEPETAVEGRTAPSNDGYLKWINGTVVVTDGYANGDVFGIEENYEGNPTANEGINGAAAFSVATTDGAVVVKGAEGKTVVITNVLGQTIASTVIASSEATIAVPAGVVVVAVEGEAAVKAIVK